MINDAWQSANQVIATLEQHQFEAVIVGGAVRDFLLQKKANDVDVATSALPQEVKSIFKKTVDVGIEHGTILVVDYQEPIEVTTFRTEGTYSDRRRPDEVSFVRSLAEDLKRRDFTINAMAIRPDGEIVDLFEGQLDLQRQIIRAVGKPVERFTEDALRIIRGIRFSSQLDFTIEAETAKAMQETAHFLSEIAVERIKAELDKVFVSQSPSNAFIHMKHLKLDEHVFGSFAEAEEWKSFTPTSDAKIAWSYWSILMQSNEVLTNYKCSNDEKFFVKQTRKCFDILEQGEPTTWQLFQLERQYWLAAMHCYAAKYKQSHPYEAELIQAIERLPIQHANELAVSGKDVMTWMDLKGGPWLKEALHRILVAVVTGELANDYEVIHHWFKQSQK